VRRAFFNLGFVQQALCLGDIADAPEHFGKCRARLDAQRGNPRPRRRDPGKAFAQRSLGTSVVIAAVCQGAADANQRPGVPFARRGLQTLAVDAVGFLEGGQRRTELA